MRAYIIKLFLMLLIVSGVLTACKKQDDFYVKAFTSFNLIAENEQGEKQVFPGTISGSEVVVELPTEVDVTSLRASYTLENPRAIVQIGKMVQEPEFTVNDYTTPVNFTIMAEDRTKSSYSVRVEKKVAIKSFGFYKEDNPDLSQDYVGVIRGMRVEVTLPGLVDLTAIKARFETTEGATLSVAGIVQQSKETENDFSGRGLDYQLSVPGLAGTFNYHVNIAFNSPGWIKMGDESIIVPTASGLRIAINPKTNQPYLIYQRTGKDESGVSIPTDDRKVAVIGYDGQKWEHLGSSTGISQFRADVPGIDFDQNGVLYIGYKDYFNGEQRATVQKYTDGAWSIVGTSRFTPIKVDYFSLMIGGDNLPVIAMAKTGSDFPSVPSRGLYVMKYSGTWNSITPSGGITVFYSQLIKGMDGKMYLGIMDRSTGANKPSLYVNNNGAWSPVGPTSFVAPDGLVGFQTVYPAVAADGTAYLAYQVAPSSGRMNHVMRFNGSAWEELGSPVPSGGEKDKFALAVDPNGTLYFAWANASSVQVKTFNTETNNWNVSRTVISEKVNEFDMKISATGIPYIAASLSSNSKTVVYKFDVE